MAKNDEERVEVYKPLSDVETSLYVLSGEEPPTMYVTRRQIRTANRITGVAMALLFAAPIISSCITNGWKNTYKSFANGAYTVMAAPYATQLKLPYPEISQK
jgi:hypothetical protein